MFIMIIKGSLQNFVLENELFHMENGERLCDILDELQILQEILTASGHVTQV